MSDEPTDIVFNALKQMQANGTRLRASLDTCGRLRETTSGKRTADSNAVPVPVKTAQPKRQDTGTEAALVSISIQSESSPVKLVASDFTAHSGIHSAKLEALRTPVLACTKCPQLVQSRTQIVFGVGNPDAEVMFVGEAPGADEDMVGEPFVGRAGQLLTKIIEAMNFRRQDVYIANILKCRPNMPPGEKGNRKPTPAEMNVCKPYLLQQIEIIQPKILVALGGTAVDGLLGMDKAGITKMRGTWKEFHGIPLMPTFHPSFLLRPSSEQNANKRLVWEDMLAVLAKLGHEISAKQRGYFLAK